MEKQLIIRFYSLILIILTKNEKPSSHTLSWDNNS
jgi:hypothetical protein